MKVKPIILSGGSGVRLWPISRKTTPKQFVDIFNSGKNLFTETLDRINNSFYTSPIIISNKQQRFDVLKLIRNNNLQVDKMILEDSPKNTAPAIAITSHFCSDNDILCFLPSDHYIKDNSIFLKAMKTAATLANKDHLVVLGIKSKTANNNYGYITYNNKNNQDFFKVIKFIEKPSLKVAKKLIKDKAFWNSGIVVVKNTYLKILLKKFAPSLFIKTKKCANDSYKDKEFTFIGNKIWDSIKSISFDNAILEKNFEKLVVPLHSFWSDLGTYESLFDVSNSVGDVINLNSKNCFLFSNDRLLVTNNVNDLIVVNTKNVTLVSKRGDSNDIRNAVRKLIKKNRIEVYSDMSSNRPWGSFTNLGEGNGYKVKKLEVLPGQKISLQKHFKRSEHWVVVKGVAYITKGKKSFSLRINQSTFIKKGEIHRIENKGKSNLIMIEVQTGTYLEEDDIKRYEDIYNR